MTIETSERPERKGRQIAMTDEIDALLDQLAQRETLRRRGRVNRADLVEEWARAASEHAWPLPVAPAELAA
jgi:hypothetical protein